MTVGQQDVSHLADSAENIEDAFSFEGARATSGYHKWTVCISIAFGGVALALGLLISVIGLVNPLAGLPLAIFVFAPLGLLTGIAIMCLFAPKTFLQGSVGRVWMNVIGVQTPFAARLVCLLFLTIVGFFLGICLAAL